MTTFSYTTGNPAHLTGGAAASMTDIGGSFTDVQTFINGANIDATNLATSAKPATLLGIYRTITEATFGICTSTIVASAAVFLPTLAAPSISGGFANGVNPYVLLYVDPADYAVSGLTAKFRVVATTATNTVASTINFTYGLYPVTSAGGNGGVAITAGTVVSGSTVTRTAPATSSVFRDASSDFTPPTAGVYALGFAASAIMATNSAVIQTLRLEYRHV